MVASSLRTRLLCQTIIAGCAIYASPALAQEATAAPSTQAPAPSTDSQSAKAAPAPSEIVVTGSLLRRSAKDIPPTVVSVSAADLQSRGINTVSQALQTLSSNGSGTLMNSFSANGAFAAGASAPALRGLTTNSTLVLFDGMRSAYYPLADDGQRNFVDTNTIPSAIVDRVETLQDGASSSYGADAVAGVVNIIVKKEIKGFHGQAESGLSQRGDAAERRLSATYGFGDLKRDGWNVYVNAEYQKDSQLFNRDRGYPYNTDNLSDICGPNGGCLPNNVLNGIQWNGDFTGIGTTTVPVVRPYDATNTNPLGAYQLLNPAAGCGSLTPVTLTPGQQGTTDSYAGPTYGANQCQQDLTRDYGVIQPRDTRVSATIHGTIDVGSRAQAYAMFNFYQNRVYYDGTPGTIYGTTPPSTGPTYNTTTTLALPVYVCAGGVNCDASNGVLNPNNPFAAQGQVARIYYRFGDIPRSNEILSRTFHGSAGIHGAFGDDWDYNVDVSGSNVTTRQTNKGYLYVQHLIDVVNDGSYNFLDPSANSQAIRNYISPTAVNNSRSQLYHGQATLSHGLFDLPGGEVQLLGGAAVRYEAIDAPSFNPQPGSPTERYFTINPFGASGHRWVQSGFFELNAPIVKPLSVNVSGRYDHYSSGQSNFSPKVTASFTPIRQVSFHGSFSKGFRIPSFAEANALPTTGYVNYTPDDTFRAEHGFNNYSGQYSLGLTSAGNPNLKPEKATNFTGGVTLQPKPWLSLTADYFHIKKTHVIVAANTDAAVAAYYAGDAIPAGYTVIPDVIDPENPTARPRLAFVQSSYVNANSLVVEGLDFSMTANVHVTDAIKWISSGTATYTGKFNQRFPDGSVQHYAGTIGPYNTTSASGTPRWRASWMNTVQYKDTAVTATVYYTSGYKTTGEDNGDDRNDCSSNQSLTYYNGASSLPGPCKVKRFIDVDLNLNQTINDKLSVYANIYNVFDAKPPRDYATYGGYNYNPAWANQGIIGRYFKVGANVNF
jgi:iron complex outermembrane recepter protein